MGLFKRVNLFQMTPRQVQQAIEEQGLETADATVKGISYFVGNKTEALQALTNGAVDSSKGVLTAQSGHRLGTSFYSGAKDYAKGDYVCTGLCAVSGACELTCAILVWIPLPTGKICALSGLKGVSYTCMKIRNLCAGDASNPLC